MISRKTSIALAGLIGCVLLLGFAEKTERKPRVIFIGDSTVKNGSGDGRNSQWGWGDQIAQYFDTCRIAVVNKARGGRSSRTYISEGLWDETLNSIKAGDFVLIQFGHNDGSPVNDTLRARGSIKGIGEETEEIENLITKKHETVHTFGWYLRKYVADIKAKGATPIIVSPIPRDNFKDGKTIRNNTNYGEWAKQVAESENVPFIDLNERVAGEYDKIIAGFGQAVIDSCYFYGDHTHTSLTGARNKGCRPVLLTPVQRRSFDENGKIVNTHGEYPDAVRKLAADENLPLIDLHQKTKVLYEALGVGKSIAAFVHYPAGAYPGQKEALKDNTHFNAYGGYEVARCVVEGMRENNLADILRYLRPEVQRFNPQEPDDPATFSLPASPFTEIEKPEGN
jgi:lysophospholipase L1-like esterase